VLKAEALRLRIASWTWEPGGAAQRLADEHLLAREEDGEKKRAHRQDAKGEEEENAGQFADQVFVTRDRLGQDGVDGAILDVAREKLRGGHDREERSKYAHRA
jgi:hypothetical protein